MKTLLNDDIKNLPYPPALLANFGFTPINVVLSDIRPMVRAELKIIDARLPKGGDALTAAHYADLHLRIKEALSPTKPVINLPSAPGARSLNDELPSKQDADQYLNCWPKVNIAQ